MAFTLTNGLNQTTGGVDNVNGTSGNDVIIGSVGDDSSYSLGDVINGGAGTADRLYVSIDDDTDAVEVSNVEIIDVRDLSSNEFDASSISGALSINSFKSKQDLTITDVASKSTKLGITDTTNALYASFKTTEVSGVDDAITLVLNAVGTKTVSDNFRTTNVEVLNIESAGTQANYLDEVTSDDNADVTDDLGNSTLKTINVTGAQNVKIVTQLHASVTTVDASAATGAVDVKLAANTAKVTGGSGADTFRFWSAVGTNTLDTTDVVDGGAGRDTLELAEGFATALSNVKSIEILGAANSEASDTYDMSVIAGLEELMVTATGAGSKVTASNGVNTVTVRSDNLADGLDYTHKDANASVTLNVDTSKFAAAGNGVDIATTTTVNNIKTLTINATGKNLAADATNLRTGLEASSVAAIDGNQLTTINLTGDSDIEIATADTGVTLVDASAFTGNAKLDVATSADMTVKGGLGNDLILLGSGKDNVDAGAGNDTVTLDPANLASTDTLTGGEGSDTLELSDDTVFATVAENLTNVSSFEKIQMANDKDLTLTDDAVTRLGGTGITVTRAVGAATQFVSADGVNGSSLTVTVDGSSQTGAGALNYTAGLAKDNYTGTLNGDIVTVTDYLKLSAADKFNGGAGADTVQVNIDGGASLATLKMLTAAQLSGFKSFNVLNIDDATATYIGVTLDNTFVDANASANALTVAATDGTTAFNGFAKIDASAVTTTVALTLTGGSDADTILGGAGADEITGGAGADSLTGGAGKDDFHVSNSAATSDKITDFNFGELTGTNTTIDQIQIEADYLGGASGAQAAAALDTSVDTVTTVTAGVTGIDNTTDVAVFTAVTYADAAALEVAIEGLDSAVVTQDFFAIYQDNFGNVRIAIAESDGSADSANDYTVTDAFVLTGVTITGIASLIDTGDFIVV